jgi:hypothetical protein
MQHAVLIALSKWKGLVQNDLLAKFGFTIAKKESRVESGHYKSETTLARSPYQRGHT